MTSKDSVSEANPVVSNTFVLLPVIENLLYNSECYQIKADALSRYIHFPEAFESWPGDVFPCESTAPGRNVKQHCV